MARQTIDGVRRRYAELPIVLSHLTAVALDIIETAGEFLGQSAGDNLPAALQRALEQNPRGSSRFERYQVNVLVDNAQRRGAPVLHEDNPTCANLVGRIDHEGQFGTLVTHFMLSRSGALHRAIGGYLVLDALKVIQQPFAWEL